MPQMMVQTEEAPRDTRMTLVNTEFLNEYGGRLMAGTVVLVDERTARRWKGRGIAVDSAITDKTLKEQKASEIERLRAELEAIEHPEPVEAPLGRRGRPSATGQD